MQPIMRAGSGLRACCLAVGLFTTLTYVNSQQPPGPPPDPSTPIDYNTEQDTAPAPAPTAEPTPQPFVPYEQRCEKGQYYVKLYVRNGRVNDCLTDGNTSPYVVGR